MNIFVSSLLRPLCGVFAAAVLLGCSPTYDWREVRGEGAPYMIMLPAKPATYTRAVALGDFKVDMSMTGAETDGVTFAVGTAELANPSQAQQALQIMKTALVRNINGSVKQERQVTLPGSALSATGIEAASSPDAAGNIRVLHARFIVNGKRVYQLVVLGSGRAVPQEALDMFFSSFRQV